MQSARKHLATGGVFAMYNYYRAQWLVDRYANTLNEVYGTPPCIDDYGRLNHLAFLVTSKDPSAVTCQNRWVSHSSPTPAPATDDHPFPYLRTRSLPMFYVATILLILLASLVLIRVAGGPLQAMTSYTDLFFMGGAFLL